jgi:hypothetical protein
MSPQGRELQPGGVAYDGGDVPAAFASLLDHLAADAAGRPQNGRIKADADVEAVASLLLGACFQQAFLATFEEREPAEIADRLADTLLAGL